MDGDPVLDEVADEAATVTLNQPAKLNAFDGAMSRGFAAALDRADADDDANSH